MRSLIVVLLCLASSCTWTPRNGCIELMYGRAGKNSLCYDCRGAIVPGEVVGPYGTACREPRP